MSTKMRSVPSQLSHATITSKEKQFLSLAARLESRDWVRSCTLTLRCESSRARRVSGGGDVEKGIRCRSSQRPRNLQRRWLRYLNGDSRGTTETLQHRRRWRKARGEEGSYDASNILTDIGHMLANGRMDVPLSICFATAHSLGNVALWDWILRNDQPVIKVLINNGVTLSSRMSAS
ncbi:potassium channel NKT1 [Striga asiatica]|uniref:Potassium channel NKT1 n=1 Tax=Striga asiatica TaxID=4170 RepID=A0A5A7Q3A9_STRAF|nr:potassium channel NKT1 [Striga asiatica]